MPSNRWRRVVDRLVPLVLAGCVTATPGEPLACHACHGSPGDAAPPQALGGAEDGEGVGAHPAHTTPFTATPVACNECHVVPASLNDEGHIDTPWPAEIVWGPLAVQDVEPAYDFATQTCTVYCHGASLAAPGPDPSWQEGAAASACGRCHGNPPPAPHPDDAACANCHPPPAPPTHIDGIVQLGGTP